MRRHRFPDTRRGVLAVVAAALLTAALTDCGGDRPGDAATRRAAPAVVDGGRLIDVGGRTLYLKCLGAGRPTVVLEAGFPGDSTAWNDVQAPLGRSRRTCAYDRAGLGNSPPIRGVHDASDEIVDLQRLLRAAHLAPPYLLVGHSYGGLLVRLF